MKEHRLLYDCRVKTAPFKGDFIRFTNPRPGRRQIKFSSPHFKLFLKQSLIEFYFENVLIQWYTLPDKATGKIKREQ